MDAGAPFLVPEGDFPREEDRNHGKWCKHECGPCPRPRVFRHRETGAISRQPCRLRRCPYCGPHIVKPRWQARHFKGLQAVTSGEHGTVKRFTVTAPGTAELLEEWQRVFGGEGGLIHEYPEDTWESSARAWFNDTAPSRWNHFLTLLRQRTGIKWEFWKVAERQVRGVTHYQGSLRAADGHRHFIPMEVFRKCAVDAGFGSRVGLDAVRDLRQAVGYAGKAIAAAASQVSYHGKTLLAWAWKRQHVVTTSRGWCPTWERRPRTPGPSLWEYVRDTRRWGTATRPSQGGRGSRDEPLRGWSGAERPGEARSGAEAGKQPQSGPSPGP